MLRENVELRVVNVYDILCETLRFPYYSWAIIIGLCHRNMVR